MYRNVFKSLSRWKKYLFLVKSALLSDYSIPFPTAKQIVLTRERRYFCTLCSTAWLLPVQCFCKSLHTQLCLKALFDEVNVSEQFYLDQSCQQYSGLWHYFLLQFLWRCTISVCHTFALAKLLNVWKHGSSAHFVLLTSDYGLKFNVVDVFIQLLFYLNTVSVRNWT